MKLSENVSALDASITDLLSNIEMMSTDYSNSMSLLDASIDMIDEMKKAGKDVRNLELGKEALLQAVLVNLNDSMEVNLDKELREYDEYRTAELMIMCIHKSEYLYSIYRKLLVTAIKSNTKITRNNIVTSKSVIGIINLTRSASNETLDALSSMLAKTTAELAYVDASPSTAEEANKAKMKLCVNGLKEASKMLNAAKFIS